MSRRNVYRPGGYKNKGFSMDRRLCDKMQTYPNINWSNVVNEYLKVYLYDLEQQKQQNNGHP